jgi:hypothetical protein
MAFGSIQLAEAPFEFQSVFAGHSLTAIDQRPDC